MRQNGIVTLSFVALTLALLFLRLYAFEENVMFIGDQGRDALIIHQIVTFEKFTLIGAPSSIGMVFLGPFYYYLVAPFLPLFGFNPAGLAYGVAFFAILGTLIATGIIAKKYHWIPAVTFLALVAFSATLIDFSRFSWNPNLLPYLSFFTLFFFVKWLEKPTLKYGMLFGLSFGLSIQLHYLALLLVLPFALLFGYELLKGKKREHMKRIFSLGTPILTFCITLLPLIVFDIRHDMVNLTQLMRLFAEGKISDTNGNVVSGLLGTVQGATNHILGIATTPLVSFILIGTILVLAIYAGMKMKSRLYFTHLIVVITYVVMFSFINSPKIPHYYTPIYVSFYFVLALIPWALFKENKFRTIGISSLFVLLFLFVNAPRYYFLTREPNDQIGLARAFADSFKPFIKKQPIQVVTIPFTESHGHFRYFLKLNGVRVLPEDSVEQAEELYVMCFTECKPQDDPQWQIAAFHNKMLAGFWKHRNVTIYKFIHGPKKNGT